MELQGIQDLTVIVALSDKPATEELQSTGEHSLLNRCTVHVCPETFAGENFHKLTKIYSISQGHFFTNLAIWNVGWALLRVAPHINSRKKLSWKAVIPAKFAKVFAHEIFQFYSIIWLNECCDVGMNEWMKYMYMYDAYTDASKYITPQQEQKVILAVSN